MPNICRYSIFCKLWVKELFRTLLLKSAFVSEICNVFSSNGDARLLNYTSRVKKTLHGHCLSSKKQRLHKGIVINRVGVIFKRKIIFLCFSLLTHMSSPSPAPGSISLKDKTIMTRNSTDYHWCVEGVRPFALWRMIDGTTDGICSKRSNDV